MKVAVAGLTLVSLHLSSSAPGPIKVEWFAFFTLSTRSVVLTVTSELSILVSVTSAGVTIALASASNGQV